MDYVKRIISLEGARTRTQGLMPYYELGNRSEKEHGPDCGTIEDLDLLIASGDNGNWGQFVANPCFLSSCGKTYNTMLERYYTLLNEVRDDVKLRKVKTKEGEIIFTEDVGAFYLKGECFSGGTEPEFLYDYAAYDDDMFYSTEIDSIREETKRIYRLNDPEEEIAEDFIVLVKDYEKFNKTAGYLDDVDYGDVSDIRIQPESHYKWAQYCKVVDACIGKLNIPASIYNKHIKVPKSMAYADIESYLDWLVTTKEELSGNCCDLKLWEERGGDDMIDYLGQNSGLTKETLEILNNLEYAVPYISLSLLLTDNFTDIGVLTNIDGVPYNKDLKGPSSDNPEEETRPHGKLQLGSSGFTEQKEINQFTLSGKGITIDQIIMVSGEKARQELESGITIESSLKTLRESKKYMDDKDNVLPGLFQLFNEPAGKMYACVRSSDETYYKLTFSAYTTGSGEEQRDKYAAVYVKDSTLSQADVIPKDNNLKQSYPPPSPMEGEDDPAVVQQFIAEQEGKHSRGESNVYIYCCRGSNWEMKPLDGQKPKDSKNADGQESETVLYKDKNWSSAKNKLYRTITTAAAGIRIAQTQEEESGEEGDYDYHYFFFVKYDNSKKTPMKIPYEEGNIVNAYYDLTENKYRGDILLEVNEPEDDGKITFRYALGGYFNSNGDGTGTYIEGTGDEYYEEHTYKKAYTIEIPLDGVDNVPVWVNYIDFEADAEEFYSPRFNLTRTGNTALLTAYTSGEIWNSGYSYDVYLTKEEYLTCFSSPPKVDVNVTIDRGGVSAFERHYKLSECNTMQDLEQHSNGAFFSD